MKFLNDNPLDPKLARLLAADGHDAVHVAELGLAHAADDDVFARAAAEDRVLVSADTDFGTLLALTRSTRPSVLLFRRGTPRSGAAAASLLRRVLPEVAPAFASGAIVVIDQGRTRVRRLPIGG
ncbi:MAG: hypothetical protein HMLKMBBP_00475 [Planctomycetes bacterium]|nr:hypothetical protein [Planctomycetota bacterium]